jgi:hypothetical protein
MLILFRNTDYSLQICGFAIFRLGHQGTLQIWDLWISGFAICGLAHLRNWRICDCGMS